jgi:hypothetical protein
LKEKSLAVLVENTERAFNKNSQEVNSNLDEEKESALDYHLAKLDIFQAPKR